MNLIEPIPTQTASIDFLRAKLAEAEKRLAETNDLRESSPLTYLAKLIYGNKSRNGTYGYDYGEFNEGGRDEESAKGVLALVDGNLDLAERVIVNLDVKHCAYGKVES